MKTRNSKFYLLVILLLIVLLSGCVANIKTPMIALSLDYKSDTYPKVGYASCKQFVWVFMNGDCSLAAAMQNGGITKVHHVDTSVSVIVFGAYSRFTTVVYGE
jgi:hypothetical protein